MKQGFEQEHFTDENGMPSGGHSWGTGFAIAWQHGPLGRGDSRKAPNGAFVEDVIDAALHRIRQYQDTDFACEENEEAIGHLVAALGSLDRRTKDREARAVEGTHAV